MLFFDTFKILLGGLFLNILELKLTELKPYQNNPRNNDEAVEPVANSIKTFGFKVPIVVDKNNVIIAGQKLTKKLKAVDNYGKYFYINDISKIDLKNLSNITVSSVNYDR